MRGAAAFLTRLRRDVRGNVLALTAAALIPLIGLVGGGIDLSRLYLSKVRLQHACDAGALAGRKAMGAGTWGQASPSPSGTADQFFAGNFKTGSYATTALTHTFWENSGKVSGTASVTVPMTMMSFFGMAPQTLTVNCSAQMQIPNTDVMFVLDNTGSMACDPNNNNCNSGSTSKIYGLKNAVKCFYEAVTQLTTNGTCPSGNSTGQGVSYAQIRFGFVPYNTNVNVGRLMPSSYFANSWPYQSRSPRWWILRAGSGQPNSQTFSANVPDASYCNEATAKKYGYQTDPSDSYSDGGSTWQHTVGSSWTHSENDVHDYSYSNGSCTATKTVTTSVYDVKENVTPGTNDKFADWHYGKITQNISALKNGAGWNSGFTLPLGTSGAAKTINWDGCIEERQTVANGTSFDPIPAGDKDLDIDGAPSQSDSTTLWAPALPDLIYLRSVTTQWSQLDPTDPNYTASEYAGLQAGNYFCPKPSTKVQTWATSDFDTYVDALSASGNTHHDIGMLWGGRLLSPTGLFNTGLTSTGGTIQRHMIFMTDGDAQAAECDYAAYGLPFFDKRTTTTVGSAASCPNESATQDTQVNSRLAGLCTAVKNKSIILWVISFGGSGIAADTKTRLQACATDANHYFDATDTNALNSAFQKIAAQITQLRLVQ